MSQTHALYRCRHPSKANAMSIGSYETAFESRLLPTNARSALAGSMAAGFVLGANLGMEVPRLTVQQHSRTSVDGGWRLRCGHQP
jgi:hypothetical protein